MQYIQQSRIRTKRSDIVGVIPTIPISADHTDGTWLDTDLYIGEFFINTIDEKVWYRSDTGIIEISDASNQYLSGLLDVVIGSPIVDGDVLTYNAALGKWMNEPIAHIGVPFQSGGATGAIEPVESGTANGEFSFAFGYNNTVSGDYSAIIGGSGGTESDPNTVQLPYLRLGSTPATGSSMEVLYRDGAGLIKTTDLTDSIVGRTKYSWTEITVPTDMTIDDTLDDSNSIEYIYKFIQRDTDSATSGKIFATFNDNGSDILLSHTGVPDDGGLIEITESGFPLLIKFVSNYHIRFQISHPDDGTQWDYYVTKIIY